MDEKSIDPLELKKKILFPHLEFVKEMLVKVKGNSIEEKWKIIRFENVCKSLLGGKTPKAFFSFSTLFHVECFMKIFLIQS